MLNGLRPPFVNDQANKLLGLDEEAFPGALGIGDKILIPNFSKPPEQQPQLPTLGVRLEETAEVHFLGADLAFEDAGGRAGAALFDIPVDVEGGSTDVKTVRGIPNLEQGLIVRMRTEKGTDTLYKKLGLQRIVGLNIVPIDLEEARFRFSEALEQDPRVASVPRVDFDDQGTDALIVDADAEIRGFTENARVRLAL